MTFQLATTNDFDIIMQLYRSAIGSEGCTWNNEYPNEEILKNDIYRKDIYCLVENNEILGAISIDADDVIDNLPNWSPTLYPSKEIARLVVKENFQNKGIARVLLTSIMQIMKERGNIGAHFLVSKYHEKALRSYAKLGFNNKGEVSVFGVDWLCYEKEL